jgi:hypothetical protein
MYGLAKTTESFYSELWQVGKIFHAELAAATASSFTLFSFAKRAFQRRHVTFSSSFTI